MSDVYDFFNYGQKKRALGEQNAAALARNAYTQFLSQQRGNRQKFDIRQGYERQVPKVMSSFLRRGLAGPGVKSGIYQRGLTDLATQNLEDLTRAQQDVDAELGQSNLEKAQLNADYQQQLADLEAQKQLAIANAAATLTSFKPFLGG